MLSLSNQLTGIELRDDALQYLIHYRGQYSLVVVLAKVTIDAWKVRNIRSREHTTCDVDHLKIYGPEQQ